MKFSPMYALLIVAMASTGFAQTSSTPTDTSPSPTSTTPTNTAPPSSQTPTTGQTPTSGSGMASSASQNASDAQQKDPHNIQSSGPETWGMLQGHEKGYISKTDAMPNSWIAQNFSACDKDRDGKVTQAEYDKCDKKQH